MAISRRKTLQALAAAPLLLLGCRGDDESDGGARVRLLNLQADVSWLSLRVDGTTLASQVPFESLSGYGGVDDKTLTTEAISDTGAVLLSAGIGYSKDASSTVVIAGADAVVYSRTISASDSRPDDGKAIVRAVNLAARGQAVDVYITAPGATIANATPTLSGTGVGGVSGFVSLDSGSYRVRVTQSGARSVIYDSDTVSLGSRQVITLVFYTVGSGQLLRCFALYGVDDDQSKPLPSTLARVKFVNGTNFADRLRAVLDGTAIFNGVPAHGVSSYLTVRAGNRSLVVETDVAAPAQIASAALDLKPAIDYTAVVTGTAAGATLHNARDVNIGPRSGFAKLRVVNAARDGVSADLSVNFRTDFTNVSGGASTASVEYAPATYAYSARYYDGASGSIDFPNMELEAGKSYVAYLLGGIGERRLSILENQ